MCQTNNIQKRFTAGTICYKVLYKNLLYGYSSLYQKMFWELGQTYKTSFYNLSINQIKEYYRSFNKIEFGFFHAFINKVDAFREQIDWGNTDLSHDYIIAEMEIPPYTDYCTGITDDGIDSIDSIATPVITFKRIL